MPADKLKRRSSRRDAAADEYKFDSTHSREIELKRSRGEISCAECRRLKIKCDKQVPCQSCQRRGCASLCPNGSLATGQGTRFVLAATEHLHKKIARYGSRIRELEDALATLQAKHSTDTHPLLKSGLTLTDGGLSIEETIVPATSQPGPSSGEKTGPSIIDAFGTLSISENGVSRFFGPTGGSESLLVAGSHPNEEQSQHHPSPPHSQGSPASLLGSTSPPNHSHSNASPYSASSANTALFSHSFPFTPIGSTQDMQQTIESHLPSRKRAVELLNSYFEQASWLFRGVTREQVFDDMLPAIYAPARRNGHSAPSSSVDGGAGNEEEYTGPHDLALLFLLFAIGALLEYTGNNAPSSTLSSSSAHHTASSPSSHHSSSSLEEQHQQYIQQSHDSQTHAEHFHQIGKAAMCLQPVLEKPSLVTIQGLHLMSIFNALVGSDTVETSMEVTWSLITLAAHLSQTIGLHRDSARWGLTPKLVQRRRILFWDLFVADVWQSLHTGRPPSFSLAYIDCAMPEYPENEEKEGLDAAENAAMRDAKRFELWGFRFAAEVVAEVGAKTLTAEPPSYSVIMDLDRRVREFQTFSGPGACDDEGMSVSSPNESAASLPAPVAKPNGNPEADKDLAGSFTDCVAEHIKEVILLYIHRSFFAQAMIDNPVNPLKSAYSPSFLAAFRASSTILTSVKQQFERWPIAVARFWTMLTFAFSAAVVFGTVVTRGPRSPLASSAMTELEQACALFSKAAVYSPRARKALTILSNLRHKARIALSEAQNAPSGDDVAMESSGLHWHGHGISADGSLSQAGFDYPSALPGSGAGGAESTADELTIFAGHTRFVKKSADLLPSAYQGQTQAQAQHPQEQVQAHDYQRSEHQQTQPDPNYGEILSMHAPSRKQGGHTQLHPHQAMPEYPEPSQGHGLKHGIQPPPPPMLSTSLGGSNWMYDPSPSRTHPSNRPQVSPGAITPLTPDSAGGYMRHPGSGTSATGGVYPTSADRGYASSRGYPEDQMHGHHIPPQARHPQYAQQHHHQHQQHPQHPSSQRYPSSALHLNSGYPSQPQGYEQAPPPHRSHRLPQQLHSQQLEHQQAGGIYGPSSDLADLGIAARDSKLDQNWAMFMAQGGLLDSDAHMHGHGGYHGHG